MYPTSPYGQDMTLNARPCTVRTVAGRIFLSSDGMHPCVSCGGGYSVSLRLTGSRFIAQIQTPPEP